MDILLVDDDQPSRISVANFLRGEGYNITECSDGYSALDIFSKNQFHLVLTDIKMPGMSGIELLKKIRGLPNGKDIDIVLFTAYGDVESAVEALRIGAYDYLLKPINVEELIEIIERVAEYRTLKTENKLLTEKFTEAVESATEETKKELLQLKKAYSQIVGISDVGIFSESMKKVFEDAKKLHSARSIPILIEGETGVGKEVVARYIHYGEGNITTPFIDINCAAIASTVFESELFGYEAGAFTGALPKGQKGKFDIADGGTIFLDEITEMPINLQAKLLRVIQEKEFYRVNGLKKIKVDVRIICSTNVNIKRKIEEGTFREDLYYRLNVGYINIPPLRERKDDIIPLTKMFLTKFSHEQRKNFKTISKSAEDILLSYNWQGNVRELKNIIEWIVLMYNDEELKLTHLESILKKDKIEKHPEKDRQNIQSVQIAKDIKNFSLPPDNLPLDEFIDEIVIKALQMHNGNKTDTARYLGISFQQLFHRLKKMGM